MSDTQVCPYCNKVFMLRGCEQDKALDWNALVPVGGGGTAVVPLPGAGKHVFVIPAREKLIAKLCAILRFARGEIVQYAFNAGYDIEAGLKTKDDEAVILKQIDDVLKEVGQ